MLLIAITSIVFIMVLGSLSDPQKPSQWHPKRTLQTAEADARVEDRVSFQTVAIGTRSAVRDSLQTVARTQSDWSALWQRHTSNESSPPALPVLDFSKEIVVAVFLGEKPTGGHGIEITRVFRTDHSLVVWYHEKSPPSRALTTQALTQPFHIVRIPDTNVDEVSFRRVS